MGEALQVPIKMISTMKNFYVQTQKVKFPKKFGGKMLNPQ